MGTSPPFDRGLEEANRRLSTLYEVSKVLTHIRSVEETVRAVFGLLARALPLRSALVVLETPGQPLTVVWTAEGVDAATAAAHASASYRYLVGAGPAQPPAEAQGIEPGAGGPLHFIVLPIVAEARSIFGVMQVDVGVEPSEQDLMLVNAVVNQLAVALEWRTVVETRQADAEAATSRAELGQATAERLQQRYQALAVENARLLHKAEQASLGRENVLAIVSHDLRNQLDAILMSVTLLLRRRPMSAEDRRANRNLVTIQRSARGMARLIGDLLDVAAIESGNLTLTVHPERVGSLVTGALELLEEQAAAASLRLTAEIPDPDMLVACDRERMSQVFANLVGNALKVTPPGGALHVRVAPHGPVARFSLTDTGPGIVNDELPHVFDRFWQGHRAPQSGAGLGLAIVKGIVEAHGGTIWLESEVGVGTTVYFTLPLALPSG